MAELGFPAASATIVAQRTWVNEHTAVFQAWNDSIVESIALARQSPDVGLRVGRGAHRCQPDGDAREKAAT